MAGISHRTAQELIRRHLEERKIVAVQDVCPSCGTRGRTVSIGELTLARHAICEYGFEYEGKWYRADVAVVYAGGIVEFVEIYDSHMTDAHGVRARDARASQWVEIDAAHCIAYPNKGAHTWSFERATMCAHCADTDRPGRIMLIQRGAGSGKTYESLEAIRDLFVRGVRLFIYTSKTHGAVGVTAEKALDHFDGPARCKTVDIATFDFARELTHLTSKLNARRKIFRLRMENGEYAHMLMCTLDSLVRGTLPRDAPMVDDVDKFTATAAHYARDDSLFTGNVDSLVDFFARAFDNEADKLSALQPLKNASTIHITVDEGQDIDIAYVNYLARFAHAGASVNVIGDLLQSVFVVGPSLHRVADLREGVASHFPNAHEMTICRGDKKVAMYSEHGATSRGSFPIRICVDDANRAGWNVIRRCKNPKWMDVLNRLVEFERYGLPRASIVPPSDGDRLPGDKDGRVGDIVWCPASKDENYGTAGARIRLIMDKYYDMGATHPRQYMLILPYISKHRDILSLEDNLANWWRAHGFADAICLHSSEDGYGSVKLSESVDKMRIMSYHGCKGDGRDIVIAWDINDTILSHLYDARRDITFESLKHVSLTRHKHKFVAVVRTPSNIALEMMRMGRDYFDIWSNYTESAVNVIAPKMRRVGTEPRTSGSLKGISGEYNGIAREFVRLAHRERAPIKEASDDDGVALPKDTHDMTIHAIRAHAGHAICGIHAIRLDRNRGDVQGQHSRNFGVVLRHMAHIEPGKHLSLRLCPDGRSPDLFNSALGGGAAWLGHWDGIVTVGLRDLAEYADRHINASLAKISITGSTPSAEDYLGKLGRRPDICAVIQYLWCRKHEPWRFTDAALLKFMRVWHESKAGFQKNTQTIFLRAVDKIAGQMDEIARMGPFGAFHTIGTDKITNWGFKLKGMRGDIGASDSVVAVYVPNLTDVSVENDIISALAQAYITQLSRSGSIRVVFVSPNVRNLYEPISAEKVREIIHSDRMRAYLRAAIMLEARKFADQIIDTARSIAMEDVRTGAQYNRAIIESCGRFHCTACGHRGHHECAIVASAGERAVNAIILSNHSDSHMCGEGKHTLDSPGNVCGSIISGFFEILAGNVGIRARVARDVDSIISTPARSETIDNSFVVAQILRCASRTAEDMDV